MFGLDDPCWMLVPVTIPPREPCSGVLISCVLVFWLRRRAKSANTRSGSAISCLIRRKMLDSVRGSVEPSDSSAAAAEREVSVEEDDDVDVAWLLPRLEYLSSLSLGT